MPTSMGATFEFDNIAQKPFTYNTSGRLRLIAIFPSSGNTT